MSRGMFPRRQHFWSMWILSGLLCLGMSQALAEPFLVQAPSSEEAGFSRGKHGQPPGDPQGILSELNLSETQKEKLKAVLQGSRRQDHQTREALRQKRQQLVQMMRSGSGSQTEAMALQRELAQQQNALMERRIQRVYQIRSILTPEQFQAFQAKMAKRRRDGGGADQQRRGQGRWGKAGGKRPDHGRNPWGRGGGSPFGADEGAF